METPMRVVVADDDPAVREALAQLLETDPRFSVVALAADGSRLVELVARWQAQVVLLDVRMPFGGIEAATELLSGQDVTVVAVSADTAPSTVAKLLSVGVRGFLAKGRLGPDLPDLVARCCAGEIVLAVPNAAEAIRRLAHAS
jgi:DNA-binding NarL/FixJ family response regulator